MILKKHLIFFLVYSSSLFAQDEITLESSNYINVGYSIGRTLSPNNGAPKTGSQHNIYLTIGNSNFDSTSNWNRYLNYPKTGFLFAYTDFGNPEKVGRAYTFMPMIELPIFRKLTDNASLQTGLGACYNDVLFDKVTNASSFGVSTHLNWAFRLFMQYDFIKTNAVNLKIGGGYQHISNGHLRLPNAGLNSFLVSINSEFHYNKKEAFITQKTDTKPENTYQKYYSTRLGLGQNVLSKFDDTKRNVYTAAYSFGVIKNKIFKYGLGAYYRYYENYNHYIKNDGAIMLEKFPKFKSNPVLYASNFGAFGNFEFLMNHISLETEIGLNFYKPFYRIDWQINNEKIRNEVYIPAKFGVKYSLSSIISSRLGLRYYLINTNKSPEHNFFAAATINANLGQADFSELSVGYVFCTKKKEKFK